MSTENELRRERQQRMLNAYQAANSQDSPGYRGTPDREYQKELGKKIENYYMEHSKLNMTKYYDRDIAERMYLANYTPQEVNDTLKKNSPLAVTKNPEVGQRYAAKICLDVYEGIKHNPERLKKLKQFKFAHKQREKVGLSPEKRLEKLELDTKIDQFKKRDQDKNKERNHKQDKDRDHDR